MKYKHIYYILFIIIVFSSKVSATDIDNKELAFVKVYVVKSYPHYESLRLEIKPNLVTKYPNRRICKSHQNCSQELGEIKHYDDNSFFNNVPAVFLSGSNNINPNENDGGGYRIELCFNDGVCNSWGVFPYKQYSEDVDYFIKKINKILWDNEK